MPFQTHIDFVFVGHKNTNVHVVLVVCNENEWLLKMSSLKRTQNGMLCELYKSSKTNNYSFILFIVCFEISF